MAKVKKGSSKKPAVGRARKQDGLPASKASEAEQVAADGERWLPPSGPWVASDLVTAFDKLSASRAAKLPAMFRYRDLASDSLAVLEGDPDAADRFRWSLDQIAIQIARCPLPDVFSLKAGATKGAWLKAIQANAGTPPHSTTVSHDTAGLAVLAAVVAGAGSIERTNRYVGVVLHELEHARRLDPIFDQIRLGKMDQAAMLLDIGGLGGCGPDDGPLLPWPPWGEGRPPLIDRCLLDILQGQIPRWPGPLGLPVAYRLDTVTPASACPGTSVTLTGINFGGGGTVLFPKQGGSGRVAVAATTWTDTSIVVPVPVDAGCGTIELRIPQGGFRFCGKVFQFSRPGTSTAVFGGTTPDIRSFLANGSSSMITVAPGASVTFSWDVCGSGTPVRLKVSTAAGAAIANYPSLPANGSLSVVLPNLATTTQVVATLSATNGCGSASVNRLITVHRVANVYLTGLELNQATQFFRGALDAGTTPAALGNDNSIPMIASKATLVRAYLTTDQIAGFNNGRVSGVRVRLFGSRNGDPLPGSPLTSMVSPLVANRDNSVASQRGDLRRSANFRLPTSWTVPGVISLTAILDLDASLDQVDTTRDEIRLDGVQFLLARSLDVVVVRVDYRGNGGPVGAPTLTAATNTIDFVRRAFPTHDLRVFVPQPNDEVLRFNGDLTNASGSGCRVGWNALIAALDGLAKDYDGDSLAVWCGVLGSGIPTNAAIGCGQGNTSHALGIAAFREGDGTTAAQEIGHAYDLDHTFDNSYANYPDYGYADRDSIGEYGVEVESVVAGNATMGLNDPTTVSDYMSYDSDPKWTSPDTFMDLLGRFMLWWFPVVLTTTTGRHSWERFEHLLICGSLIEATGAVKLNPMYHLPLRRYPIRGHRTHYDLVLVDAEGAIVQSSPLVSPSCCAERITINQAIPWAPDMVAVEVRDGDKVLTRVERPQGRPHIDQVKVQDRGEEIEFSWRASHDAKAQLLAGIALSPDGGKSWNRVARMIRGNSIKLPKKKIVGGDKTIARVVVTDGMNTAFSDSAAFSLARREPVIIPHVPASVAAGEPIPVGFTVVRQFGDVIDEKLEVAWESDKDGPVATTQSAWVSLSPGKHRLTVKVRSGSDTLESRSTVQVLSRSDKQ